MGGLAGGVKEQYRAEVTNHQTLHLLRNSTPVRVIILTQYFPPETGAPQNRLFELAVRMQQAGAEVQILTGMPNYPHNTVQDAYKGKLTHKEEIQGLRVLRSWIYVSKKAGIVRRLLNYFSFTFSSAIYGAYRLNKADVLICESPPLFLGMTGVFLSWIKGARFVFNVSDLWPESVEKLDVLSDGFALRRAYDLERWLYRKSSLVTGQTQGIVQSIQERHPDKRVHWLPNTCDLTLFDPATPPTTVRPDKFVCLYAGIIGIAQGLDTLIEAAALLRDERHILIQLAGGGPELERLQAKAAGLNLKNIEFLGGFAKAQMPGVIASADVAMVPLKKLDLFKGAIPSKIFENCAMEKPLLLGVEGEAKALFIDQADSGWDYEPENAQELAAAIRLAAASPEEAQAKGKRGRAFVKANFDRDVLTENLMQELSALLG